ncbi:MAG: zinc-binding alcohol dehydrogenase family protein [Albidovulum sp.]|nr:zinc-binding alcohol dehydrogenase family protein [Albidovulum sp.]
MIAIAVDEQLILDIRADRQIAPGPGEVMVRVKRAGICGSDVHILEGSNPFARYPRIIGHEMVGEVAAVGAGVVDMDEGNTVVIDPVVSCGYCRSCRMGRSNVCANLEVLGVHRDGGFRTFFTVPRRNAVRVSPDLPVGVAALAEPFSIAANVLSRTGCTEADAVLVYGAGPIGLTVLQVAKLKGARCIVADLDEARLEFARGFGADEIVLAEPGNVRAAVAGETSGLGPTVVVDAAGEPGLLSEALEVVSPAGRIGLLGFSIRPVEVVQKEIVSKEVAIHGSRLSRNFLPQVVAWLENGELQPKAMISDTFAAEDAKAAFARIRNDRSSTIKVQLEF